MKKRNFLIALVLTAAIALLATGCEIAYLDSTLEITSAEGAGTRTFRIEIKRDHIHTQDKIDANDVNSRFFPKGTAPIEGWAQERVPAGFTVDYEEQADYWIYTVRFDFSDIDDYNAKMQALMDEGDYLDYIYEPATLVATEATGGHNVTFKELEITIKYSILKLVRLLNDDEEYFADRAIWGGSSIDPESNYDSRSVTVKIGETSETVQYGTDAGNELDESAYLEVSGFLPEGAEATEPPVSESPPTGDSTNIAVMAAALGALAILALTAVRRTGKSR